jgi:hypothetical protein
VPDEDFEARVDLTADQCVVDESNFFIRGHIQIPIDKHAEPLAFAVWTSLSKESFDQMSLRWDHGDRVSDGPYFGWLCTPIWIYPDTIHLPLSVRCRPPGQTPLFTVENNDHPLAIDQQRGITVQTWHELALKLLS